MQPRESESQIRQDRISRYGTADKNTGSFDNGAVGDPYRETSTTEKCLLQPTKSNAQDTASQVQPVQSVFEEDNSTLFPFD
jgi:hypothetical protein